MSTLSPHPLVLGLTPADPRLWPGPPVTACWRLRYLMGSGQWRLDYGDGWIEYGISTAWNPWGANTFDVILADYSGQAPASVTVWPYTAVPCPCPDQAGPGAVGLFLMPAMPRLWQALARPVPAVLHLVPFAPALRRALRPCLATLYLRPYQPHLYRVPATLRLAPSAPAISTVSPLIVTTCCPSGMPDTFHLTIASTDWPVADGTWPLTWLASDPTGHLVGSGWYSFVVPICGVGFWFAVLCEGGSDWNFYWWESGFEGGLLLGHGCTPALDGVPFLVADFHTLSCGVIADAMVTVDFH